MIELIKHEMKGTGHAGTYFSPKIEYFDSNNQKHILTSNFHEYPPKNHKGDEVAVCYKQDNPDESILIQYNFYPVYITLFILFLMIGLYGIIHILKNQINNF